MAEGKELPNQEKIRTLWEKETYKYLGMWEADIIKQMEMKETLTKDNFRRKRQQHEKKPTM